MTQHSDNGPRPDNDAPADTEQAPLHEGARPAPAMPEHSPSGLSDSPDEPARPVHPARKPLLIGLGAGFLAGILASFAAVGVAGAVTAASQSKILTEAVEACSAGSAAGVSIGDKGNSLSVDTKGKDDLVGAKMDDLACLVREVNTPDSVVSQMDSTSSLQGRQTAEWDDLKASWTYHPDSGMKLILEIAKK